MALISDLLDMSALDSGRMRISPETIDMRDVVAGMVDAARAAGDKKQIPLAAALPPAALQAWADRPRIEQVISNLLSNAIKYTSSGGPVDVWLAADQDEVDAEIRDNGIGVPQEEQPFLFEKFF